MRILLVLGNVADSGGPTKYAQQLLATLTAHGHTVEFATYADWLWKVPFGIRHISFTFQLLPCVRRNDVVLGFDTMTVGLPLWLVSHVVPTPYVIRVGGDFVWEQFVESTGRLVKLSKFYETPSIPLKQRLEVWLTGRVVHRAKAVLFNSNWLNTLWQNQYHIDPARAYVVENLYPPRKPGETPTKRVFVAAGRPIKLKQEVLLHRIFGQLKERHTDIELDTKSLPPAQHQVRVSSCYAVILPSVSDVSPNAIIDAVTYGKPFVCTADTGIRERLEGTGLFVDTSDEHSLLAAIESLLDPMVYAHIETQVKNFTLVRTWDDIANDVEQVLEKIV